MSGKFVPCRISTSKNVKTFVIEGFISIVVDWHRF
jgi:hypothetical protein